MGRRRSIVVSFIYKCSQSATCNHLLNDLHSFARVSSPSSPLSFAHQFACHSRPRRRKHCLAMQISASNALLRGSAQRRGPAPAAAMKDRIAALPTTDHLQRVKLPSLGVTIENVPGKQVRQSLDRYARHIHRSPSLQLMKMPAGHQPASRQLIKGILVALHHMVVIVTPLHILFQSPIVERPLHRARIYNFAVQQPSNNHNSPATLPQGSVRIYAHLAATHGGKITPAAAAKGLELYDEHVADARARPGAHPNIDILFKVIADNSSLDVLTE